MAELNDIEDPGEVPAGEAEPDGPPWVIPQLEGWMTLPDAARALGITRSRIHQLVPGPNGPGQLRSARKIGKLTIVRTVEVENRLARLRTAAEKKAPREAEG